jgi:hypothetical protein
MLLGWATLLPRVAAMEVREAWYLERTLLVSELVEAFLADICSDRPSYSLLWNMNSKFLKAESLSFQIKRCFCITRQLRGLLNISQQQFQIRNVI